MDIRPAAIRRLAELALVLEPTLDKAGCTTRYHDLPDKPLAEFLIAAVNVGVVIESYAVSVAAGNQQAFSHFRAALETSNMYKRKKFINVGLLEILFVTIKVRLTYPTLAIATQGYEAVLQGLPIGDIGDFIDAYRLAWSTSTKPEKRALIGGMEQLQRRAASFYEWRQLKAAQNTDATTADYQFNNQYLHGFPLIETYIDGIDEQKGLLKSIEDTYAQLHQTQPQLKIGVLADFSAAALFLYLSYQDAAKYQIK